MPEEENKKGKSAEEADQEEKTEEVKTENEEFKERLLRMAAEFDNYKKRATKDIDNAKGMGKAELIAKLLPIIDEFHLAIESLEMKTEQERGLALVLSNFTDVLKKEGLKEIDCNGVYDPYKHEVIMTKESKEKEGTVIDVIRKGYALNEIMLRPASVIVSEGSGKKEETKKE
jgi:molecular chaperone GrpE